MALTTMTPDDLPKNSGVLRGVQISVAAPPNPPVPTHPGRDARFLDPLILEYIDGHNWKLVHPFNYQTDVLPVNRSPVKIPEGFITDFASIPKIFWNVMPPTGPYGKAAVVHDYLYRTKGMATRPEADRVFLEAMTALGVGPWTRQTMYYGVRVFGGGVYHGGL